MESDKHYLSLRLGHQEDVILLKLPSRVILPSATSDNPHLTVSSSTHWNAGLQDQKSDMYDPMIPQ
ncbi:hypothetical protein C4D60_Mb09t22920 [Musa balbisiana]|uniref:Uncharacterized protein n=1 Tax=Musa balbisiana TaxID=52838 RepID=A0A4S8IIG9_MUSBA|nr:hypothetical protein C4D60_Mb09t22920 [Musa balbisiana]